MKLRNVHKQVLMIGLCLLVMLGVWLSAVRAATVNLTFAGRMGPTELATYEKLLREYEAKNPGVKIRIENYSASEYDNKILVEMAAGTPPDVMYIHYSRFPQYAKSGALFDLTPFIERDKFDLDQFFPATRMQLKYKGKEGLGIPRETSSIVLFYNQDMFDEFGLAYPNKDWTYDTTLEVARKLSKDLNNDGTNDTWGILAPWQWFQRVNVVWAFGGSILNADYTAFTMNQAPAVKAIQWIADLIWKHKVSPQVGTSSFTFTRGNVGMFYAGYWDIGYHKGNNFIWDAAMLPSGPAGRYVRTGTGGYAIPAGSKNKEEAWKLLKYLASYEAMVAIGETGVAIPAHLQAALHPSVIGGYPKNRRVFVESLQFGRIDPVTTVWNEMNAALDKALAPVWAGREDAQHALSAVEPTINALLKQQ
ncbi:MAG: sugar ABC transporter substrate-binding protein [Limnochordales bacterium]|nr:sugar ABC transporter substrate-binding protein [Limnochordales bacterium]